VALCLAVALGLALPALCVWLNTSIAACPTPHIVHGAALRLVHLSSSMSLRESHWRHPRWCVTPGCGCTDMRGSNCRHSTAHVDAGALTCMPYVPHKQRHIVCQMDSLQVQIHDVPYSRSNLVHSLRHASIWSAHAQLQDPHDSDMVRASSCY